MEIKHQRKLEGVVSSDKMVKTVVVSVTEIKTNPKYLKQYKVIRKFKAHDEKREYHLGDKVVIGETRPLSKTKRWTVISKIN